MQARATDAERKGKATFYLTLNSGNLLEKNPLGRQQKMADCSELAILNHEEGSAGTCSCLLLVVPVGDYNLCSILLFVDVTSPINSHIFS